MFILIIFHFGMVASQNTSFKSIQEPLIYGGKDAKFGQFPYIVSINVKINKKSFTHHCGGSILRPQWIITAKHCSEDHSNDLMLTVGTTDWNTGIQYSIEKFFLHPSNDGDIGLWKIKGKIRFDKIIQPISIDKRYIVQSDNAIVAGWGHTEHGKTNNLKFLQTKIIKNEDCIEKLPANLRHELTTNHICSLNPPGHAACFGDSGGPLTINGKLIGVVYFGHSHCEQGVPVVHVRLSKFQNWINFIMDNK